MIRVLEGQDFDSAEDFVKAINAARLANKNKWIVYVGTVNGKAVEMKNWNTGYLQILRINGIDHAPPMDLSVTGWKDAIRRAVA